jgi:2-polyprenyl-6-methoxyphenol hydroxylase-like FAD-dependent oxidoreductase
MPVHDIAIAGAGPAGAALAQHLALAGLDVLLIDRHAPEHVKRPRLPGERVWGETRLLIEALGVACEEVASPLPVTRVLWDEAEPRLIAPPNPLHWALAVDRRALDAALIAAAEGAGARVIHLANLRSVEGVPGDWRLALDGADAAAARYIVDATGRQSQLASALGLRRRRHDGLVAVLRWWRGGAPEPANFAVEAVRDGWFYRLPLPGGSGGVMGAVTFRTLARGSAMAVWREIAGRLAMINPSQTNGASLSGAAFFPASPSILAEPLHPGFAAVGDAALAADPIEGRGIENGLRMAEALSGLMLAPPVEGERLAGAFRDLLGALHRDHLAGRSAQYGTAPILGPRFQALAAGF